MNDTKSGYRDLSLRRPCHGSGQSLKKTQIGRHEYPATKSIPKGDLVTEEDNPKKKINENEIRLQAQSKWRACHGSDQSQEK